MLKKGVLLSAMGLLLMTPATSALADTITFRGDLWCPYNCEPNSAKPGYMIEIAKEVFEKAGHTVDYQTMPWARTLEKVKAGEVTVAIGATKDTNPSLVYGTEKHGVSSNTFAIRAEDSFEYKGTASLEEKSLAIINGYSYTDEIDAYVKTNKDNIKKVQATAGDTALETNLNKLVNKRVDLFIEDTNVLSHQIASMNLGDKIKVIQSPFGSFDIYLAFSPANPKSKEYTALLDKGMDEMRKSGKLAEILGKYGLKDWK